METPAMVGIFWGNENWSIGAALLNAAFCDRLNCRRGNDTMPHPLLFAPSRDFL